MNTLLAITFRDLLNPEFYINNGGLWVMLFIVFAETGLMVGFFLPGDSLLFVAGIYSQKLIDKLIPGEPAVIFLTSSSFGFWFLYAGSSETWLGTGLGKSGHYLFQKEDNFLFKKKHLFDAKSFYDKHGGQAIVFARFLPIIRTFAPIIAGIVQMEKRKFMLYNLIGCIAWVFLMLFAGHYLDKFFIQRFNFDLKKHLEIIVIGIVLITTLPVLYKMFFGKKPSSHPEDIQS